MGTSVIIPAYRERENLEVLLPDIFTHVNGETEVIVINDESGDDTYDLCMMLRSRGYHINCLNRTKTRGLTSAIKVGIQMSRHDNIIVMDADGQHPPKYLPSMIEALNKYDLVVGTRYFIKGGSCTGLSGIRKLGSIGCNLLAYPLTHLKDSTSGFFGFKRWSEEYSLRRLDPKAFKIGLELYTQFTNKGEIPISFIPRVHGSSKMTATQVWRYFRQLARLYIHKWDLVRMSKFYAVGGVGVIINYAILLTLVEAVGFDYKVANIVAIMGAAFSNFKLNVLWTFKSDD